MARTQRQNEIGFSLLELLASISILIVISGAAFGAVRYYEGMYQRTDLTADMHDATRSAIDLMGQEIGQAGLLSSTSSSLTTLAAAVTGSGTAQAVTFTSASSVFVGEKLLVDVGSKQELVAVTAVSSNSVTGIFAVSHSSGAVVYTAGVFPQGVLSTSTTNQLQLVGDINGDGTLVYVEYDCNNQSPGPGTLTRSSTAITSSTKNASSILVDAVMPNPGGTACFQYHSTTAGGFTFVTQVGVTLTVQSSSLDPVTAQYLTVTKQALDLVPRNVQMGLNMANANITSMTGRLQPTPSGIPILN